MQFTLNAIDIAVIVISLALVVICGLWAARREKHDSAHGYFLASGKLPWWIIGTAFVSTSVSSEQIVGTIGAAYDKGMAIANWEWWSFPVYTLLILIFIPLYLKNRITTVPEILTRRYGPICGNAYSWSMLIGYVIVFLVPVLHGGSLTFSSLTGFNYYAVLWIMLILVAVYTVKGGLLSVMWTDALQCIMLLGGGLVLYFVALNHIPCGWGAMVAANPERFHLYHPADDPQAPFLGLVLGTLGVFLFYSATNQVMIQRVLGARSRWDGIMGVIFAGFINLARPLVTCFLGLIVYHWIHEMNQDVPLAQADYTFPYALKVFAPEWGLRGIILAGFLAAVMSTVSALANSTATIYALDVHRKVINPQASDRSLVRVGQIASLIALGLAGLIAPAIQGHKIFNYFQMGVTYISTPFITVILVGLLWKRANYAAGVFGVIGGILIQAAVALLLPLMGINLFWIYNAVVAQVLIVIGMVVVALITPPPALAQWQPFLWTPGLLRELNTAEGEIPRPFYQNIWLWFSLLGVSWGYLYWLFW